MNRPSSYLFPHLKQGRFWWRDRRSATMHGSRSCRPSRRNSFPLSQQFWVRHKDEFEFEYSSNIREFQSSRRMNCEFEYIRTIQALCSRIPSHAHSKTCLILIAIIKLTPHKLSTLWSDLIARRGAPSRVKTLRKIAKLAKTELVHKFRESGKIAGPRVLTGGKIFDLYIYFAIQAIVSKKFF